MSDRKDFYFQQPVQENELDSAYNDMEVADLQQAIDWGIAAIDLDVNRGGIMRGLSVLNPSGLNIDVVVGAAYDHQGRRVGLVTQKTVDISKTGTTAVGAGGTPSGGVSTDPGAGNRRWVTVFIVFDRDLQDPRVDGLGAPIFFERRESFRFIVSMGTPAPTPGDFAPLQTGTLLLGDFRITDAGAVDAIDLGRRQVWLRGRDSGSVPVERDSNTDFPVRGLLAESGIRDSIEHLLGYYNDHVRTDGLGSDQHSSADLMADAVAGTPTSLSAGTIQAQTAQQVLDINLHLTGASYRHASTDVDAAAIAGTPVTLPIGTTASQLATLLGDLNQHINGSAFQHAATDVTADALTGSPFSVPAGSVQSVLQGIEDDLNTHLTTASGAHVDTEIQSDPIADLPLSLLGTNVRDQLTRLLDLINNPTTVTAAAVTYAGGSDWKDGTTNPSTDVETQLDKIITDLIADAGADRMGAAAHTSAASVFTNLTAGSMQDALNQISDGLANAPSLTASNTHTSGNQFYNAAVGQFELDNLQGMVFTNTATPVEIFGQICRANTPKMWVNIQCNGATGAQPFDGYNVTSVTAEDTGQDTMTVSIDANMANAAFAVLVTGETANVVYQILSKTVASFIITFFRADDAATSITLSELSGRDIDIVVFGTD